MIEKRLAGAEQRIEFDTPEGAIGFIDGVSFMDTERTLDATLEQPREPWSHGKSGKWVVVVRPKGMTADNG